MRKIILFNGPPRSGKDTATKLTMEMLGRLSYHYRFAAPLKDAVHSLFGMSGIMLEHFDTIKEVPLEQFFGMTPRDAYIWLAEKVVKPKFGEDFFAKVAANHLRSLHGVTIVISDSGFQEEMDVLVKEFGADNVHLVHMMRENCSFANDSRSYINHDEKYSYVLNNNGTLDELKESLKKIIGQIEGAKK